jgi:hypothetical protein
VLGLVSQNWVCKSCPPGALKQHRSATAVVFWQLNCGSRHVLGPDGNPVGVLLGAVLVELIVDPELVVDVEIVVGCVVEVEVEVGTVTLVLELVVGISEVEVEVEVGTTLVELVDELEVVVAVVEDEVGTILIVVELDVDTAIQLQALLTLPATSPPQAATAYEGIALVAATTAVVNVAQNA